MKRKILSVLLAVTMTASVLAGCGNSNTGGQTDNEPAEITADSESSGTDVADDNSEAVEMETITVWSDQYHEKELREKQIAEFNAGEGKELGIQIDYQVYGDGYTDTLRIAAQAGEAPDLYKADGKWLPEFVESEYAIPIEELPGSEELISQYSDLLANQAQIFDGKTYTLPYNMTTYGMVINTDLFEACGLTEADYPTTWEEVREVAKIITEKTSYGKSIENTEFFKENGGLDASDYISIHSRKHMYDPDTVSTPKKTQYGKDVNVGKLCEDTIMKPDEVIYNKDQNVMIYKKEYPFNISTSDTPTGTHRVFIPLNTQGKKTIRMSQFPLVGGN